MYIKFAVIACGEVRPYPPYHSQMNEYNRVLWLFSGPRQINSMTLVYYFWAIIVNDVDRDITIDWKRWAEHWPAMPELWPVISSFCFLSMIENRTHFESLTAKWVKSSDALIYRARRALPRIYLDRIEQGIYRQNSLWWSRRGAVLSNLPTLFVANPTHLISTRREGQTVRETEHEWERDRWLIYGMRTFPPPFRVVHRSMYDIDALPAWSVLGAPKARHKKRLQKLCLTSAMYRRDTPKGSPNSPTYKLLIFFSTPMYKG